MRKINCDFCNKDISDEYDTEHNLVDAYEGKTFDLCSDCVDKYWEVRSRCGDKYSELSLYYRTLIDKEMEDFYHNELEKLKEKYYGTSNIKSSKNRKRKIN